MRSKTLTSFDPIIGFARAQIHNFLFSALIFTVTMVGISFACSSNSLYGYAIKDISYIDPKNISFAAIIAVASFVFAAFTFKPFMAKNESDTFLSLPIKKNMLLTFQILFGIACIILSSLISYGLIYPALNLTKFTTLTIYAHSLQSMFCEIVLPMCVYYLLSVILIMKTGNFFSSFLLLAAFSLISFCSGMYINDTIGFNAIGADITEITNANQPFYYSAQLFLPVRFVLCILKAALPFTYATVNMYAASNIITVVFLFIAFAVFILSVKQVILGELNRPFAAKPMIKTLPIAVILAVSTVFMGALPFYMLIIIGVAAALVCGLLLYIYSKSLKNSLIKAACCLIATVLPLSVMLTNATVSDKITYDIPKLADIKCVYFNPVYPVTTSTQGTASMIVSADRYCFTSDEAIASVLAIHKDILEGISKYDLIHQDSLTLDEEMTINPSSPLNFNTDKYQEYRDAVSNGDVYDEQTANAQSTSENDDSAAETTTKADKTKTEDGEQWGLFDQNNVGEDYWSYMFDYDMSTDIAANKSLPLIGSEKISYDTEEVPKYAAAIYYQLNDGRWIKRLYTPIPNSWIKDDMLMLFKSAEYLKFSADSLGSSNNYANGDDDYDAD